MLIQRNSGILDGFMNDYGPFPLIINIDQAANINPYYRTAMWTGPHLQVTLMSIPVGGDIGLEMHPELDQFIRVENGYGLVKMGKTKDQLNYTGNVNKNYAIIIPAGSWHNLFNVGSTPLKLYSIYTPPQHPFGTVHETKQIAEAWEHY